MTFSYLTDPASEDVPPGGGRPEHRRIHKQIPATLDVVAVISNPVRYRSRNDLARAFFRHAEGSGARLTVVECAFGNRPFELTETSNPRHVQVRTAHEVWLKENLGNIGVSRLPRDWRYVCLCDADVMFARPDWVQETLQQLQHYPILQPFSHCIDLGPDYAPLPHFYGPGLNPASWGYCHVKGFPLANTDLKRSLETGKMDVPEAEYGAASASYYFHPGFAWAYRREAWDALGGLIEHSILGAGDYLMAAALTGHLTMSSWLPASYTEPIFEWQRRAEKYIQGNVGYAEGLLQHFFHGAKRLRGYKDRWRIFFDSGFDPSLDLKKDWQGVLQLTDRNPRLRDGIRAYLRSRNEDGIEV